MNVYSKTETLKTTSLVKSRSILQTADPEKDTLSNDDVPKGGNKGKNLFEDYIRKYAEKAGKYFWQVS